MSPPSSLLCCVPSFVGSVQQSFVWHALVLALVACTIRWLLESEYRRATTPPSPSPRNLCPFWSPIRDLGKWLICLNSPEEFLSLRCKDTMMTLRYLSTLSHFMMCDPRGPWRSHHALCGAAGLQVAGPPLSVVLELLPPQGCRQRASALLLLLPHPATTSLRQRLCHPEKSLPCQLWPCPAPDCLPARVPL